MFIAALKRSIVSAGLVSVMSGLAFSQTFNDTFAGFGSSNGEPIEIEASELQVEDNSKLATFTGDVVVIQGETRLETQQLKVFYDGNGNGNGEAASAGAVPAQQEISRLEADGGVYISSKDQTATGDAASFDMAREIMIMTGREVVLNQGPNVVVGNHLTVNLKTGQALLKAASDGGADQNGTGSGRVKVRILPNSVNSNAEETSPSAQ
ncbi:MAG: LptA/OstA family protein [Roseibium sp.]